MNRAILIVICDFLVSAMLSMLTGMVPAGLGFADGHGGGGTIGAPGIGLDAPTTTLLLNELQLREAQLEELRRRLREMQQKEGFSKAREGEIDKLARELASTRLKRKELTRVAANDRTTTGKLSPAELKRRLQDAQTRLDYTNLRLSDAQQLSSDLKKELKENVEAVAYAREKGAVIREKLASAKAEVQRSRETLQINEQELRDREQQLREINRKLEKAGTELAVRKQALANLQQALAAAVKRNELSENESKKLERNLSFVRGRLSTTERAYAESRDDAEKSRKLAASRELELEIAKRQLTDARSMLTKAVTELSVTKRDLAVKKMQSEKDARRVLEANLRADAARKQLAATGKMLDQMPGRRVRSDVLLRYAQNARLLTVDIVEKRLMIDQKLHSVSCLPSVKVGGKTVLIGGFDQFTGAAAGPLNFIRVSLLSLTVGKPGEKKTEPVAGPLMLVPEDVRVAAIEIKPPAGSTPLPVLTPDKLCKRGVEDLYLFKSRGRESSPLGDRCSLDLASGGTTLFIRNGRRAELKAQPGDLVLTREGELAGVVVASESPVFNRREDARCFIFPEKFSWEKAVKIPLNRRAGEKFFEQFGNGARANQELVRALNSRDR